MHFLLFI